MNAADWISHLKLLPHPEGGYYRETYRSAGSFIPEGFSASRNFGTAIYFLLEKNNFSAFHKIKSDETWHFYAGDPLEVIEINQKGELIKTKIGNNPLNGEVPQYTVPAHNWFGSRVLEGGGFSLVGCTVAPGFDFDDFEMAAKAELRSLFPKHSQIISELTRS